MKRRRDAIRRLFGLAVALASAAWLGCSPTPNQGGKQPPQLLYAPAAQTNGTCTCTGTGPGGAPVTVDCEQSACGSDYQTWACSASGWAGTGVSCSGNGDAGTNCQCQGTGPGGVPVTADCGQSACGSNYYTYACSASGWSWTGTSCTGSCECTGTGAGNVPVTVACGQSACGSDYQTYACSASGWAWTGASCTGSCECTGNGAGNAPVTVSCGQSACGSDYQTYACSASGWSWTGASCSGNGGAGGGGGTTGSGGSTGSCQCTGNGPGNVPVTVSCGQSACGSDNNTWTCSASGWGWTGLACSTGTGGSGTGGSGTGGTGGSGGGDVTVQLDNTYQTIQGFGINTALYSGTPPISTMFSTSGVDGIGLSILRVGMNTNGSLTGSGISEARSAGAKIIGSCWSAPAICKSNGSTLDGGYLLESCYDSWSTTIANFASQQNLYAMSLGDGPDFASCPGNPVCTDSYETMTYTAKQAVNFVKVAGPKLKAKGIKVIAPEASEWLHVWSNLSATGSIVFSHPDSSDPHKCGCFSNTITADAEARCAQTCKDGNGYDYGHWLARDTAAWAAFDILGLHEFDSQIAYAWPADVTGGKRDKEVWQTEMAGVMHWPEQGPSTDINNGIAVAGWIHSALTVGEASAWLYWWYQALYQDDNEGLALLKSGSTKVKRYYTMGNYSKFVRPGYIRVDLANASTDVLLSAYKSADAATIVIVAINKGSGAASPTIGFAGGTPPASCTPTVTSSSDNLKDGTTVTVTDGVLTTSLASKTVTTYVCR
jgi:glucuronoarabinoxylan endo-1,4-beta-xylanase